MPVKNNQISPSAAVCGCQDRGSRPRRQAILSERGKCAKNLRRFGVHLENPGFNENCLLLDSEFVWLRVVGLLDKMTARKLLVRVVSSCNGAWIWMKKSGLGSCPWHGR